MVGFCVRGDGGVEGIVGAGGVSGATRVCGALRLAQASATAHVLRPSLRSSLCSGASIQGTHNHHHFSLIRFSGDCKFWRFYQRHLGSGIDDSCIVIAKALETGMWKLEFD